MLARIPLGSLLLSGFGLAWSNVQPLEVAWIIFGVIGLYFAHHNYRDAAEDSETAQVLAPEHDKAIVALAQGHIRTEANRMLIHSIVIVVGLLAILTPPTGGHQITIVGLLVTLGLFCISAITILQSILDRRLRHLIARLEEEASHARSQ